MTEGTQYEWYTSYNTRVYLSSDVGSQSPLYLGRSDTYKNYGRGVYSSSDNSFSWDYTEVFTDADTNKTIPIWLATTPQPYA